MLQSPYAYFCFIHEVLITCGIQGGAELSESA